MASIWIPLPPHTQQSVSYPKGSGLVGKSNHLGHIYLTTVSSPRKKLGVMSQSTIHTPHVEAHLKARATTVARHS